ncbi:uncharacterized protein LOC106053764 isoform X1 [Biomphalaria glabrata]|uniref:Uncharacterized protein LOC106053764 isoform X1 n=3 Tax=Biomphalaria glabrata TaxID=6526 RepID=A0A9U8DWU1_BIOGL|nr:uncharacterized protein LOC106053764 isoform X1 [Biomphalaria glabrata]
MAYVQGLAVSRMENMHIKRHDDFRTNVKRLSDEEDEDMGTKFGSKASLEGKQDQEMLDVLPSSMDLPDNVRSQTSLCELPYGVTLELMNSMDNDKGWEQLAAAVGYTFDNLLRLGRKQKEVDGSPTKTLLWELGSKSYTVKTLYEKLRSRERVRDMQILLAYVKGCTEEEQLKKTMKKPYYTSVPLPKELDSPLLSQNSSLNSPNSEVNFNQPHSMNRVTKTLATNKKYDDKVIPGTVGQGELASLYSDFTPGMSSEGYPRSLHNQLADSLAKFPGSVSPQRHQPIEMSETQLQRPVSHSPTSPPQGATSRASSSGAENIKRMLQDPVLVTSPSTQSPGSRSPLSIGLQLPKGLIPGSLTSSPDQSRQEENMAVMVKSPFSCDELYQATEGYSDRNVLGEGNFGKVYKGHLRGQECAIKKLKTSIHDAEDLSKQITAELTTLLKYQHENILTLYGYAVDNLELCLVYQYLSNGSLEDRLALKNNSQPLSWERRLNIIIGTCKGLSFLHTMGDQPLIHGDIKSANILLDKYLEAKIADLGQAKYATSSSTDSKGFTHITIAESLTKQFSTKAYQAPEVFSGIGTTTLSTKSDVFALGVVMLEICTAIKAHDPNLQTFLKDYFLEYEGTTTDWASSCKDSYLDYIGIEPIVQVLNVAKKCMDRVKKRRPESKKLLDEMKKIYEATCSFEPQMTSSNLPTIGSVFVSSKTNAIEQMQQELIDGCQQASRNSYSFQTSMASPSKPAYLQMDRSKDVSVPLLLQAAYDEHAADVFRQSSRDSNSRVNFELPQSDPMKQAELDRFDALNIGEGINEVTSLACDPAKIAYLTQFDESPYTSQKPQWPPVSPSASPSATYGPEGFSTCSRTSELAQHGSNCASGNSGFSDSSSGGCTSNTSHAPLSGVSTPGSDSSATKHKSMKFLDDYLEQIGNCPDEN